MGCCNSPPTSHGIVREIFRLISTWIFNWLELVSIARRQELLLDAFVPRKTKALAGSQSLFAIFVKKLQESSTRMEAFDVVTVTQGMDGRSPPLMDHGQFLMYFLDSKRSSSPSLLARQLRLRLVASEGSDIP